MACPDPECHDNVKELKLDMKALEICSSKKVKRWELWIVVFSIITLLSPMVYSSYSKNDEWKKEREAKSNANRIAIEVMTTATQKDISNINEKICEIQIQQKQMPKIVYEVVRDAIMDGRK